MSERQPSMDDQIDASLERIRSAVEYGRNRQDRITKDAVRSAQRWERKRQRREEESERNQTPQAIVYAMGAVGAGAFAFLEPGMWWMYFVAFSFAMSAAKKARFPVRDARLPDGDDNLPAVQPVAPAVPTPAIDPKVARIEALCRELLAAVESGPALFKEIITRPRETIEALRQACAATSQREQELRAALSSRPEHALLEERSALHARTENEPDAVVKARLAAALLALDQQIAQRAAVATAAARLDAENTRILYTLENVRLQALRARSDASGSEPSSKLRESFSDLTQEIEAIAEALELTASATHTREAPARAAIAAARDPAR